MEGLLGYLIDFVNFLIKSVGAILSVLISLLPNSPFAFTSFDDSLISTLNWVIPINSFVVIGSAWLVAVSAFYLISVVLRFVKLL